MEELATHNKRENKINQEIKLQLDESMKQIIERMKSKSGVLYWFSLSIT